MNEVSIPGEPDDFEPFPDIDDGLITIYGRFEAICRTRPNHVAVIEASEQITYDALREKVIALSNRLTAMAPRNVGRAGIAAGIGIDTVVASMAMIRAGIPFVPIDPALAEERKSKVAETCGLDLILASAEQSGTFERYAKADRLFVIDHDCADAHPDFWPANDPADGPVCYIPTTGSSSDPKLVHYTEAVILHDVSVRTNLLKISPSDRFAQWTGGTSLPLMTQFLALLNGATLCVRDARQRQSEALAEWIAAQRISVLRVTPTLLRYLAARLPSPCGLDNLRLVSTGGESLGRRDAETFFDRFGHGTALVNHLSATEYRVACQYVVPRDVPIESQIVPVGYPLDGFEIDVVDGDGNALPDGMPGTFVIRGKYLSPGYLDTATGQSVWFPRAKDPDVIVFHSSDTGVRREDGCIEFRGRTDRTVKILGIRVELDAVESALLRLPAVAQVAVLIRERHGGTVEMVAIIEPATPAGIALADVRRVIHEQLGLFGMPHRMICRSPLPVTVNGKIDRRALAVELDAPST